MRDDRRTRRRRTLARIAIACAIVAAIVGGAAAARAWRRANQEQTAREVGLGAFERGEWSDAIRNLGVLVARGRAEPAELLAFATARMRVPLEGGAHVAQAASAIDAARAIGADPARCDRLLLEAYVEGGMLGEAQREAEAVLARNERDPEARRVFVHACIARGRLGEAERILRRAVEVEPESLPNRIALAGVLARRVREGAPGGAPDAAPARAVHAEVAGWSREVDAPAGVTVLADAIALELGCEAPEAVAARIAGPEAPARTLDEAELRAGLLDVIGRRRDADRLLAQLRKDQPVDTVERREIARIEFRRAIFSGDTATARMLLEEELARSGTGDRTESPLGLPLVLDVVICVVDGREDEARARIGTSRPASREIGAWLDALRGVLDGTSVAARGSFRGIDVVAEAALRLAEARRAMRMGMPHEALRLADDAVLLGRGRFDAAEAIAVETLARIGRADDACTRSTRLAQATGGRPSAVALRLWCESKVRAEAIGRAEGARGLRAREMVVADARAILASPDADLRACAIAAATLGSAGHAAEAADSYRRFTEGAAVSKEDCVALAECAVVLARAFDDTSFLQAAKAGIARVGMEASPDVRWASAWIDALEAERAGDAPRGFELLREAGASDRARLAIAGEFGDTHGIDGAADVLRASLPEGAPIAARSSVALRDPELALAALAALEQGGDRRTVALARLRIATAHPTHFDANEVLARAADARRALPLDTELPAAIAGFLLASPSPDPAQALVLLGDAMRLSPGDVALRERAARVALLAGEPLLAREHAESLPANGRTRATLLATIAVAEGDARAATEELARLDRIAGEGGDAGNAAIAREIAALRASALVLSGGAREVDVRALDGGTVRIARMISREGHRALVLRCAGGGADPVLVAHLAAEYLHRDADEEIASIARNAAAQSLEAGTPAAAIAAFRAAVACGDDALEARSRSGLEARGRSGLEARGRSGLEARSRSGLEARSRSAIAGSADARASTGLRREEAIAWLARDPARSRRVALELLAADPEDHESGLIAAAAAVTLRAPTPADVDRIAHAPRTPEAHLLEARMALLRGLESEARRAARDGLSLAARRAYVAFDTRAALQAIADGQGALEPASG